MLAANSSQNEHVARTHLLPVFCVELGASIICLLPSQNQPFCEPGTHWVLKKNCLSFLSAHDKTTHLQEPQETRTQGARPRIASHVSDNGQRLKLRKQLAPQHRHWLTGVQGHADALQEQSACSCSHPWRNKEKGCKCVAPRNLIQFGGGACRAGLLLATVVSTVWRLLKLRKAKLAGF